jgi:thymidylate synthase
MYHFEGDTADHVWCMAAEYFRNGGHTHIQSGRGGETQELLHAAFTIRDPRQRWVVSRYPAINPAFAIAEVVWMLNGRNDLAFLRSWNANYPKFVGEDEACHGAYGFRLRKHFGIDQLERAYEALLHNPDGRQIVLQIWDPTDDLPASDGTPVSQDIPCNICALLKIRNGRLEWTQVLRSNDLFLGVPHNFIQFTCLQEILAGWLGIDLGTYNHISDSLHVYERNAQHLHASQPVVIPRNADSLCLPKDASEHVIADLNHRVEALSQSHTSQEELLTLASASDAPQAFQNLLYIVAAEAARRRHWLEVARELITECTNPLLTQVWERWLARVVGT